MKARECHEEIFIWSIGRVTYSEGAGTQETVMAAPARAAQCRTQATPA